MKAHQHRRNRRTTAHRATLQASAAILLSTATPGFALTTAEIVASTLSPDCLEYRVIGICYWLYCSRSGCRIRTSVKVSHYVPDAVVSSYANTGENPWLEVRPMSLPNPSAQGGNDGTTNQPHENNLLKFKNADAVFPHGGALPQAQQGDYAWALWRPYSCCQQRGQTFLGSTEF